MALVDALKIHTFIGNKASQSWLTHLQAKIIGALSLDVSAEHLSNYVLVWELQPFISSDSQTLLEHHCKPQAPS